MAKYLVSYAEHFGLMSNTRLNTSIHRAEWSEKKRKWEVESSQVGSNNRVIEDFDKVIYAMGPDQIPNVPKIPGIEKFMGDTTHSISFKKYVIDAGFASQPLPQNTAANKAFPVSIGHINGLESESWL